MSGCSSEISQPAPSPTSLYVTGDFTHWECDQPDAFARDVTINGIAYRGVDPEYYAWLRHRMTRANERYVAGKVTGVTYEELRAAFNDIHDWVVARFSERDLLRAIDRLRPKHYQAPGYSPMAGVPKAGSNFLCRPAAG